MTMYERLYRPITGEVIRELQKRIRIGSHITVRTYKGSNLGNFDDPGTACKQEVERRAIVTGCYPFGVTARIERSGLIDSMTWAELEMRRRQYGRIGL